MAQTAVAARGAAGRRRSSTPPPRRGRIEWHRVGRLALLGMLLVILFLYISPISNWFQQRSTAAHSQTELNGLKAEHARLQARLQSLNGPGAIEAQARAMGMVRRGEKAYVIEPGR